MRAMDKRKILVLSIGFTLILVTCIVIVIFLIQDIRNESFDPLDKRLIAPVYLFFVLPIIPEEVSLLRSVYKLINSGPETSAKISYIVSAIIVFAALVFQLSVFTKTITKDIFPDGPQAASSRFHELLLLTEWPVLFVSFALGSVKSSNKERLKLKG